jgi:hypothetical protein
MKETTNNGDIKHFKMVDPTGQKDIHGNPLKTDAEES